VTEANPTNLEQSSETTAEERFEQVQKLRLAQRAQARHGSFKPLGCSQASFIPPRNRRTTSETKEDS